MTDPSAPQEPTSEAKPLPGAAAFLGLGLSAAVCVAIGVGLGIWADSAWHTSPILLLVGLALGVTAAVFFVVSQIREFL